MPLTTKELVALAWFRSLKNLEQLAIRCWLNTGDNHLLLSLRQLDTSLNSFDYASLSDSSDQLTFRW